MDANGSPYGWAGIQAIPREVSLNVQTNRIFISPISEIESLRLTNERWTIERDDIARGSHWAHISASKADYGKQFEVIISLDTSSFPFTGAYSDILECGILVRSALDRSEYTEVGVRVGSRDWYLAGFGIDFPSIVTDVMSVDDPRLCGDDCSNNQSCFMWTYHRTAQTCHLMSQPAGATTSQFVLNTYGYPCTQCTSGVKTADGHFASFLYGSTLHSSLDPSPYRYSISIFDMR